jgi:hypothetical protein
MDGVAHGIVPLQSVKIETRRVHLFRRGCEVQAFKSDQNALVHLGADLAGLSGFEQRGERLVLERPDHGKNVSNPLTYGKRHVSEKLT